MPVIPYPSLKDEVLRTERTEAGAHALEVARRLAPELRERALEIEEGQRLPVDIITRMGDAGMFLMGAPEEVGGGQIDYVTQFRIMEQLAVGDASAGWTILVHMAAAYLSTSLSVEGAKMLFDTPYTNIAGSPGPRGGRAVRVEGGFKVTGEWSFASNSKHASHFIGGFFVLDDMDQEFTPAQGPGGMGEGMPEARTFFAPKADVEVVEGSWDTIGLRGTHSGAFRVHDAFIPEELTFSRESASARGALTIKAPVGIGGHSMNAIGIVRHALDELYALLKVKHMDIGGGPPGMSMAPGQRDVVAHKVAECEAKLRSVRALSYEVLESGTAIYDRDGDVANDEREISSLANVYTYAVCRDVMDVIYRQAASTGIFKDSPLEKCYRDMAAMGAHVGLQEMNYALIGRGLMGQDTFFLGLHFA